MAVCGKLLIYRSAEIETLDNSRGTQVNAAHNAVVQLLVRNMRGTECIKENRYGLSNADSICNLDLAPP